MAKDIRYRIRKFRILMQLLILFLTTLIAVFIVTTTFVSNEKQEIARIYEACTDKGYEVVNITYEMESICFYCEKGIQGEKICR